MPPVAAFIARREAHAPLTAGPWHPKDCPKRHRRYHHCGAFLAATGGSGPCQRRPLDTRHLHRRRFAVHLDRVEGRIAGRAAIQGAAEIDLNRLASRVRRMKMAILLGLFRQRTPDRTAPVGGALRLGQSHRAHAAILGCRRWGGIPNEHCGGRPEFPGADERDGVGPPPSSSPPPGRGFAFHCLLGRAW